MPKANIITNDIIKHDIVIKHLKRKYVLQEKRFNKNKQAEEIRKEAYNISLEITQIENKIQEYIEKNFNEK